MEVIKKITTPPEIVIRTTPDGKYLVSVPGQQDGQQSFLLSNNYEEISKAFPGIDQVTFELIKKSIRNAAGANEIFSIWPNYNAYFVALSGKVDKIWKPPAPPLSEDLTEPSLTNLFPDSSGSPFEVPLNLDESNIFVSALEIVTNYKITVTPRDVIQLALKNRKIQNDQVWSQIPMPDILKPLDQVSETKRFFIEQMGLTALSSVGDNLVGNFGGDLTVTFKRTDLSKPWTVDNTEIIDSNKPDAWYLKLRTFAFNLVTVRDHLLYTHLTYSNYLYQAVQNLKDETILKNLLVPHTLGANNKNSDAYWNLYNNKGILLGATNQIDQRDKLIQQFYEERNQWLQNIQFFPDWLNSNQAFKNTKYAKRGIFIYQGIQTYVSTYFDQYVTDAILADDKYTNFWGSIQSMLGMSTIPRTKDNVQKWVTELIWRVTYFHYQVGNAIPYLYDCDLIRWDGNNNPTDGSLWSLVVAFGTSDRQYQLATLGQYLPSVLSTPFGVLIDKLKNYTDEWTGKESPIDGIPQWVWELEPSVAR